MTERRIGGAREKRRPAPCRTLLGITAAALVTAALATAAAAEIYKWEDAKGVVHFTSAPPEGDPQNLEVREEEFSDRREPESEDDGTSAGSGPRPFPEAPPAAGERPAAGRTGMPAAAPGAGGEAEAKSPPPPPVDGEGNPFPTESLERRR